MKYALISPLEPVANGYRIAEVSQNTFEVSEPLFWKECSDEVVADLWYYDITDQQIKVVPEIVTSQAPTVQGAQTF